MNAEIKSIGVLIDELITTNMKIFWALEKASESQLAGDEIMTGKHYGKAQRLNSYRSELIRAVENRLGESGTTTEKTF